MSKRSNLVPPVDVLNSLLGTYWSASAQHQTHAALIEGWRLAGLAEAMRRINSGESVSALFHETQGIDRAAAE